MHEFKVITLCGSTRFKEQFIEIQKKLTLEGNIVISVGAFGHCGDNEVWTDGKKAMLDRMHLAKIDLAVPVNIQPAINVSSSSIPAKRQKIPTTKRITIIAFIIFFKVFTFILTSL